LIHIDLGQIIPPGIIKSKKHSDLVNRMLKEREKHDCDLDFINKQLGESKKDLYYK
jgi:hypothetical protein